ncbi:MAG: hypothetical protein Q4P06_06975 [Actinomycetaceae bacterium]|nr:hypothetical protein [Actinomycetaceae bacterium]
MARVLLFVLGLAITIYAIADCARTPEDRIPRNIPKALIILFIIFTFPVGGIAWTVISRVIAAEQGLTQGRPTLWSSPDSVLRPNRATSAPRGPVAPDDDPEFLWKLEKEIHRQRQAQQRASEGSAPDTTLFDEDDSLLSGEADVSNNDADASSFYDHPAGLEDAADLSSGDDAPGSSLSDDDDDKPGDSPQSV